MSGFLYCSALSVRRVILLGFMILIHEFGHYAVAKLLGVRVERSPSASETAFSVSEGRHRLPHRAIPLGGYVKMSGENPMDERSGDPGEFMSHPRWHRFLIAIAGPAMNILFAVGLLTCVYMVHYEYPAVLDEPAVIGWVAEDTPAAKAGIQVGDRIANRRHPESDLGTGVPREALNPNQPLDVTSSAMASYYKTIVPEPTGVWPDGFRNRYRRAGFPITDLEPACRRKKPA